VEATEEKYALLLKRLRRRWDEDDARKNLRRAEAARALMHAEQRHMLAERFSTDFQQRMHDKVVPEFVQRFVCGPWSQALAEAQLAGKAGGGEALEGVADDLIWSVQPALIRRDVGRLAQLVPRMLGQMRQGLQQINYPVELIGQFFDELVTLHDKAFDTPTLVPVTLHPDSLDEASAPVLGQESMTQGGEGADGPSAVGNDTFWMAGQEAEDAGFLHELEGAEEGSMQMVSSWELELLVGAWVNLKVQGEWVRAQLTWTSPRGGLYMFISASGMAHSMTRRTLDRLLGSGSLQVVTRGGVVEGALDAVALQALRNARTENADPDSDSHANNEGGSDGT
jgi:hypothetical protein